jgi:hypothetical protein
MAKKKSVELRNVELHVVKDFYDVTEAAIYMRHAKGSVYQMIHNKDKTKIPVHYIGRKPVFYIEELKRWILQRNTPAST